MANVEKAQKKEGSSSKKVYLIVILVIFGAALFALGVFLGTYLSGKDTLLEGTIGFGNMDGSPFTFTEMKMDPIIEGGEGGEGSGSEGESTEYETGIVLDARKNDDFGRLRWDGRSYEKLRVVVAGSITHAELLKYLEYRVSMPDGVLEAAKEGYLDISEIYELNAEGQYVPKMMEPILVDEESLVPDEDEEGSMVWSFRFEFGIKWGEKFGGMNPSDYYEEGNPGAGVSDEEMRKTLDDLHNIVMNGQSEAKFLVTLFAEPKE